MAVSFQVTTVGCLQNDYTTDAITNRNFIGNGLLPPSLVKLLIIKLTSCFQSWRPLSFSLLRLSRLLSPYSYINKDFMVWLQHSASSRTKNTSNQWWNVIKCILLKYCTLGQFWETCTLHESFLAVAIFYFFSTAIKIFAQHSYKELTKYCNYY